MHPPLLAEELARHAVAGIVDQKIDRNSAPLQFFNQLVHRVAGLKIAHNDLARYLFAELSGQRLESLFSPRTQYQGVAFRGQLASKGCANAGRSTRDQCVAA